MGLPQKEAPIPRSEIVKKSLMVLGLLIVWAATALSAADPFMGKWKMDIHKSKYPAGTCPQSMVIEMEPADHGIRYSSETIQADGRRTYSRYTAEYDGKQVGVLGSRGMLLPVSLSRLDARTILASYTEALQVVATSRRIVSKNGRLMTVTTVSRDRSGKSVTHVGVYEKIQ
jgi:hypothetical protein